MVTRFPSGILENTLFLFFHFPLTCLEKFYYGQIMQLAEHTGHLIVKVNFLKENLYFLPE